jgi:hypothetical protein
MKVAALRHAFHGDWDLDTDIGFNGIRTTDIEKELERVETLRAYSGMVRINDCVEDEPEDFMVEHNLLHHHAEMELEAAWLVEEEIHRQFAL